MQPITIELPLPPSVNHYWRHVGNRVLISAEGRRYRLRVRGDVLVQGVRRMTGRLALAIVAYPPDRRRRDLDNLSKSLLDSLAQAGVYDDDSQIDDLRITRGEVTPGGKVVVTIQAID